MKYHNKPQLGRLHNVIIPYWVYLMEKQSLVH
jgi:hypothetical protein